MAHSIGLNCEAGGSVIVLMLPPTAFPAFAVGASVTGDAVGKVRYPFSDMLGADIGFSMLMAAVAGVLPPVAGRMARGAGGVMLSIEYEEFCVIECGWRPAILAVALRALGCCAAVDCRLGSRMA